MTNKAGRKSKSTPWAFVNSSNGELYIDRNGYVIKEKTQLFLGGDDMIKDIIRFDLEEYRMAYPDEKPAPGGGNNFDILDLGYWYNSRYVTSDQEKQRYEPPATDWREDRDIHPENRARDTSKLIRKRLAAVERADREKLSRKVVTYASKGKKRRNAGRSDSGIGRAKV